MHSSLSVQRTLSSFSLLGLMPSITLSWGLSAPFVSGALHYHSPPPTSGTIPSLSPSQDSSSLTCFLKCPFKHPLIRWTHPHSHALVIYSADFYIYTLKFWFLYLTRYSTGTQIQLVPNLHPTLSHLLTPYSVPPAPPRELKPSLYWWYHHR